MNHPVDSFFEFHEGTVSLHVDDFALVDAVDGVFLFDFVPWVRQHLFHAERDFLLLAIDMQDHHFDFLIDRYHFGRMPNSRVRHVGDVQQAIDATEIDERSEVRNVLDHA